MKSVTATSLAQFSFYVFLLTGGLITFQFRLLTQIYWVFKDNIR